MSSSPCYLLPEGGSKATPLPIPLPRYDSLVKIVAKKLPSLPPQFRLYYRDEEGDTITISCDEDILAVTPGTLIYAAQNEANNKVQTQPKKTVDAKAEVISLDDSIDQKEREKALAEVQYEIILPDEGCGGGSERKGKKAEEIISLDSPSSAEEKRRVLVEEFEEKFAPIK